ncbi:MAG TPA: DUF4397 domain-containing protein [Acidimicrobiales bacterium]|nr:DUF4397 domain-containing protein [Acidimicrobiales bacterium]
MKYLRIALAALCAATLAVVLAATNAGAATAIGKGRTVPAVAEASIIQGLPKTAVDVYLNGTEVVQDFRYKGVVGPVPLAPGKYHIAIRLHGALRSSKPLLEGTGTLVAGENITIVTYLTTTGNPALTRFWNPNPTLDPDRADLIVRNVADDAGFDVYADGLCIFSDLLNPTGGGIRLPQQWITMHLTDFGSTAPVLGPFGVHLVNQTVTIVYAVGNPATSTLSWVEQNYITTG